MSESDLALTAEDCYRTVLVRARRLDFLRNGDSLGLELEPWRAYLRAYGVWVGVVKKLEEVRNGGS